MFEGEHRDPIPAGLDEMLPGAVLGTILASIDVEGVSAHDRVTVLRALQRQASHLQARVYGAMAAVADHMGSAEFPEDPELAWQAASTEIGAALRLTRRSADTELDSALGLRRRLPGVWEAFATGDIDRPRARTILHGTSHLDEDDARRVAEAVLGEAPALTTGQLAERIRRLCIEADPGSAGERYRRALDDRRVVVEPTPNGTAHLLGLDLPPERVSAISRRIDDLARSLGRDGDPRNIDQRRADVFLDLLAGKTGRGKGGVVEIRVDARTLAELADDPGDLAGYGPVIADIARRVAADQRSAEWRFTVTDPDTGLPVHDGTTRRRPTASQRRAVEARDRTCIFPGCRMPAVRCDLDHRIPWRQRRRTGSDGLDSLCRHHHVTVRHLIGWKHLRLPDGDHLWTGLLGHGYTTSGRSP